jgi:hypothetical protein
MAITTEMASAQKKHIEDKPNGESKNDKNANSA